jgi:hypothetical protein
MADDHFVRHTISGCAGIPKQPVGELRRYVQFLGQRRRQSKGQDSSLIESRRLPTPCALGILRCETAFCITATGAPDTAAASWAV